MNLALTIDEAETIIAFVKMHEREEISDEVWDIIMKLQVAVEWAIDNAPTVDAVPVVRCRECKNWETDWMIGFVQQVNA